MKMVDKEEKPEVICVTRESDPRTKGLACNPDVPPVQTRLQAHLSSA